MACRARFVGVERRTTVSSNPKGRRKNLTRHCEGYRQPLCTEASTPQSHTDKEPPRLERRRRCDWTVAVCLADAFSRHKFYCTANGSKRTAPMLTEYYRPVDFSAFALWVHRQTRTRSCGACRKRKSENHAGSQLLPSPPTCSTRSFPVTPMLSYRKQSYKSPNGYISCFPRLPSSNDIRWVRHSLLSLS